MNRQYCERLIALRKSHGYTIETLAGKLSVSPDTVGKWESGELSPEPDELKKLAGLYGMSIDYLLSSQNNNYYYEDVPPKKPVKKSKAICPTLAKIMLIFPYPVLAAAVYVVIGFVTRMWGYPAFMIFLSIPIYYLIAAACLMKTKTLFFCVFPVPIIIVCIYLFLGLSFAMWHPYWLIFLIIPVYYWIIGITAIFCKKKK